MNEHSAADPDFTDHITPGEAARILGVSTAYLARLRDIDALLPVYRSTAEKVPGLRRSFLYRKADVEAYRDGHPRLGKRRRPTA